MQPGPFRRQIDFEGVINFRDLGGYRTQDGRSLAWGRVYRSASLLSLSGSDIMRLKEEIKLKTAIDLRTPAEHEQKQEIQLLREAGAGYINIPFRPDNAGYFKKESELYSRVSSMGEIYIYRIQQKPFGERVVAALEVMANPENQPLVFHCSIGKDRTGVLAAILLGALDVEEESIISDYVLSAPCMPGVRARIVNDPKTPAEIRDMPDFTWEAAPLSISLFLSILRQKWGSIKGYLEANGADVSLVPRLKKALLVS